MLLNLLLLFAFPHQAIAASSCYLPAGGTSGDVPCDPDADVSLCCRDRSDCLTNGLCRFDDTNTTGISYARGSCTDKTWTSSVCPQHCQLNQESTVNPDAYDFGTGGVQVWECGSQGYGLPADYCCESEGEKTRCCSTSFAVFELAAATIGNPSTSPTSSISSPASTISTSSSSTQQTSTSSVAPGISTPTSNIQASTPAQTNKATSEKSNIGLKVGFGVGVPLGIALIVALTYLLWYKRRNDKRLKRWEPQAAQYQSYSEPFSSHDSSQPYELQSPAHLEMAGDPKFPLQSHELHTVERKQEMEAHNQGSLTRVI